MPEDFMMFCLEPNKQSDMQRVKYLYPTC